MVQALVICRPKDHPYFYVHKHEVTKVFHTITPHRWPGNVFTLLRDEEDNSQASAEKLSAPVNDGINRPEIVACDRKQLRSQHEG